MNKENQNVAIATACGWKDIAAGRFGESYGLPPEHPNDRQETPDYPNDLNACHEMEKVLFASGKTDTLNMNYWEVLWLVCGDIYRKETTIGHATAAQRCEAFLKTLGLWKDEPTSTKE